MRSRLKWLALLVAVGDGVVTAMMPARHARRWAAGPGWYRRMMRPFAEHPQATRALGATEAAVALWWTARQPDRPS